MIPKTLITTIAVIVIVAGALLYMLFKDTATSQDLVAQPVSQVSEAERSFIVLFQQLERISLDMSFFQDSYFRSLIDVSSSIVPLQVGKRDPFAPI
jgi:phosphate starvation-inducible membrane PsiE